MMNDFLTRFRILPLLVLVALLAFGLRLGETVTDVKDMTASALAEVQPAAGEAPKTEGAAPLATPPGDKSKTEAPTDITGAVLPASGDEPQPSRDNAPKVTLPDPNASLPEVWADPASQSMSDSPEQMQLLADLAKRRQQLDAREKLLDTREALMKASEKQIDTKLAEMGQLKSQIEGLLGKQQAEQTSKITSLVKIYEQMKPKEAAAIFNQMDMNILLQVVSKMAERKSAPIMAAMETAKANELSVRLTEMNKLPERRPQPTGFRGANTGAPVPTAAPAGSASLPGLDALGQ
jgi:flagellar motility protein MotE (MotC chaperone)